MSCSLGAPREGIDVLWCLTERGPREQTTAEVILEATP